jgi:PIN domain nuclease of toxin-antitoxin system
LLRWLADEGLTDQARDAIADPNNPFDRMLIAQAFGEALTIVTHDKRFSEYGVAVLPT